MSDEPPPRASDPLATLGWDPGWVAAAAAGAAGVGDLRPARITVVYQDRLAIAGAEGPGWAELRGRLRRQRAQDPLASPATGDWLLIADNPAGMASVEALLPRRTCLIRQAAGRRTAPQVVAANVDTVFVVTTPNRDLNPRRIERYLAAIAEGGATAAILLNKSDLVDDFGPWLGELAAIAGGVAIHPLSATSGAGLGALEGYLGRGQTVAFVGSSGVGKSSLINRLLGAPRQAVAPIRDEDDKGRHTTTHRELMPLAGGERGLVIDTPGMRELQLWGDGGAVGGDTFADVLALAGGCRFRDCRHLHEPGCAVLEAIAAGRLGPARLAGFRKLADEGASRRVQRQSAARLSATRQAKLARTHDEDPGS